MNLQWSVWIILHCSKSLMLSVQLSQWQTLCMICAHSQSNVLTAVNGQHIITHASVEVDRCVGGLKLLATKRTKCWFIGWFISPNPLFWPSDWNCSVHSIENSCHKAEQDCESPEIMSPNAYASLGISKSDTTWHLFVSSANCQIAKHKGPRVAAWNKSNLRRRRRRSVKGVGRTLYCCKALKVLNVLNSLNCRLSRTKTQTQTIRRNKILTIHRTVTQDTQTSNNSTIVKSICIICLDWINCFSFLCLGQISINTVEAVLLCFRNWVRNSKYNENFHIWTVSCIVNASQMQCWSNH